MRVVKSKTGVDIRLTEERWAHIVDEHAELDGMTLDVLDAVQNPQRIVAGGAGELLALRTQKDGKMLVAVYREGTDDGFVITAFLTRRIAPLDRRKQLWP